MNRVFIVRHGNTFEQGEPSRRIGAGTDLDLTAAGRGQAVSLGAAFARCGIRFTRALASPLRRTRRTAELVLAAQADAVGLETLDWLVEIDHGPDEGALEDDVLARVGATALDDWDRLAIPPAGWNVQPASRVEAWNDLFGVLGQGDTLVVTSSGAARFALLASVPTALPASLRLRTGAYGVIEWTTPGPATVTVWDCRS